MLANAEMWEGTDELFWFPQRPRNPGRNEINWSLDSQAQTHWTYGKRVRYQ
jgi:hypothetical protein